MISPVKKTASWRRSRSNLYYGYWLARISFRWIHIVLWFSKMGIFKKVKLIF